METVCEGEWAGFGGMFSTEESSFMAEFMGNYPFSSDQNGGESSETSSLFPSHNPASGFDENVYYNCQDNSYTNSGNFPRETSYHRDASIIRPATVEEHYYLNNFGPVLNNNSFNPMEFCMVEERNPNKALSDNVMEEVNFLKDEMSGDSLGDSQGSTHNVASFTDQKLHLKRKYEMTRVETVVENHESSVLFENPRKKPRLPGTVRKNKKNIQSKNQGTDVNYIDSNGKSSSSNNNSEEDTNVLQELSGVETSNSKESESLELNGKTRAGRGSATDPQSIYARKRRERINERLRILQTLVPNGTKVDISTMLEEAVQYVKFLQVQIKLLSSDDLWMYAPLAYNGMDIGIDRKISLPR